MKIKALLSLLLLCCLLLLPACGEPAPVEQEEAAPEGEYSITTPYEYPERKAWVHSRSFPEKMEICDIPEEILAEMSTGALIESILCHPLLGSFISPAPGEWEVDLERFSSMLCAVPALYTREDGLDLLEKKNQELQDRLDDIWEAQRKGEALPENSSENSLNLKLQAGMAEALLEELKARAEADSTPEQP
ncbi:MAG: hypothetical protein Q4B50_01985 [Bacillota bacterium]|nr:hypothetical protein [Bacillota bacterium]